MKVITEKVIAYITQEDKLLVFRHPFHPEAGIQVPAGTIEPGESPQEAVLREAHEETGFSELELRAFLGMQEYLYQRRHVVYIVRYIKHLRK